MFSRWCEGAIGRGGASSGVVHVTWPWFKIMWSVTKRPQVGLVEPQGSVEHSLKTTVIDNNEGNTSGSTLPFKRLHYPNPGVQRAFSENITLSNGHLLLPSREGSGYFSLSLARSCTGFFKCVAFCLESYAFSS
ncbi:hypothetical protein TNCV_583211 [Trichonephila clavipes]|nr:hypothetical protein TNCV_583211 [Trichonephila clavipes]